MNIVDIEPSELLQAFKAFQAAAHRLNRAWELAQIQESPNVILETEYPFKSSFDDVVAQIDTWVEANV